MIIRVDPAHTNHVAPIGPQQAENFGSHSGKHASTMILESWADDFNRRQSDLDLGVHGGEAAAEDGNWKMWEAPQLDQIQLPCIKDSADPLSWMLPLGLSSEVATPIHMGVSVQLETQLSNYSSSLPRSSCPVSLPSTSLWSDQPTTNSFFSSTLQRPSGVVGPITQEMMDGPITLADDYRYEHSPVLPELQFRALPFPQFISSLVTYFLMFHLSFHSLRIRLFRESSLVWCKVVLACTLSNT